MKTDILIVGGGPAGSLCGIKLRQAGLDCLIVDRARFPRLKLCAGVLTWKSRNVLDQVLGKDKKSELLSKSQCSHEAHLRLWNKKKCFVDCDFTNPKQIPHALRNGDWKFVLVDRPTFDNWLLQHYKSLGGKVIEGDGVRQMDFDSKNAVLSSGEIINYRTLVACDGANSHIEKLLKKYDSTFIPKGANSEAFEINVDRSDLDIDGINVCFGYIPQTYAWAFAKGDKVCLGTCLLKGVRYNGKKAMQKFCEDLGLRNIEKYPLQGALIPFDNAIPKPLWQDHVYFCGDAAGLDEAVTGEGIFYALQSGEDAADSIINHSPQLYINSNRHLQALMHKAAKYQKALASPRLYPAFQAIASFDNRFVGYFYLTQVDHSSLDHVRKIYWDYLRDLRF